jgi:hypothetical protein
MKEEIDKIINEIMDGKKLEIDDLKKIKEWNNQSFELNDIYTAKLKLLKSYYQDLGQLLNDIKNKTSDQKEKNYNDFVLKEKIICEFILVSEALITIRGYSKYEKDLTSITNLNGESINISTKYANIYNALEEKKEYARKKLQKINEIEKNNEKLNILFSNAKKSNTEKKVQDKYDKENGKKLLETTKLTNDLKKDNEESQKNIPQTVTQEHQESKDNSNEYVKISKEKKEKILESYEKSKVKEIAKRQGTIRSFGRRILYGIKTFKDPTLEERVSLSEFIKNPTVVKEEEIHEVQKRKSKDKNKLNNRAKAWIVTGITAIALFTGINVSNGISNNSKKVSYQTPIPTASQQVVEKPMKNDVINGQEIVYNDENDFSIGNMVTLKENAKIYSSAMAAEFNENSNVPLYAGDQEVLAIQYKLNDGGYKTIYSNNDNKNIEGRIVAVAVKAVGTNNGYTGWFNINDITMKEGLSR